MSQFSGTHLNKVDSKGRVSVPATFRALLRAQRETDDGSPEAPLYLRRSTFHPCLEAWSEKGFQSLTERLNKYDRLSPEYDDASMAIFADSYRLETDKEGRVVLPASLARYAGIDGPVAFMGAGAHFQIWEPEAATRRLEEARARFRESQAARPAGVAA